MKMRGVAPISRITTLGLIALLTLASCRSVAGYSSAEDAAGPDAVRPTDLARPLDQWVPGDAPARDSRGDSAQLEGGAAPDLAIPDLATPDLAMPDDAPIPADLNSAALTPAATCGSYQMPRFSKACGSALDCVAVEHIADCCGAKVVWGLAKSEQLGYAAAESQCKASWPQCNCPVGPSKLEDGNTFLEPFEVTVSCVAGICKTAHLCGGPCGGDACFRCGNVGVCAKDCTMSSTCNYPEGCITASDGGKFCSSSPASCP
jgi:hypothetical protein